MYLTSVCPDVGINQLLITRGQAGIIQAPDISDKVSLSIKITMKITIFDNLLWFPHRAKVVSLETKNFLHFLLEDNYFKKELKTLREKHGIPKNGYPLDVLYNSIEIRDALIEGLSFEKTEEFHRLLDEIFNSDEVIFAPEDKVSEVIEKRRGKLDTFCTSLPKGEWLAITKYMRKRAQEDGLKGAGFSTHELEKKMEKDLERLTTHYSRPSQFDTQFFMLIAFNAFQNIIPYEPFLFMTTNEDILDEVQKHQKDKEPIGALLVYEQVTKNQLIKWIEDNWKIIKDLMQELPKVSFPKSTVLDISKEIADLRDRERKKFWEIADYLTNKYPDDPRVTDESWVKETYRRYKNRLRAFTKDKQQ